jgi:hypothetical protein
LATRALPEDRAHKPQQDFAASDDRLTSLRHGFDVQSDDFVPLAQRPGQIFVRHALSLVDHQLWGGDATHGVCKLVRARTAVHGAYELAAQSMLRCGRQWQQ